MCLSTAASCHRPPAASCLAIHNQGSRLPLSFSRAGQPLRIHYNLTYHLLLLRPASASAPAPSPKVKTVFAPYAVKIGEELFGGQKFGVSDIETKFTTQRTATLDQYLGLFIDFPLTASNEDEGFGQCHTVDYRLRTPVPCKFRRLVVKFPREVEVTFRVATEEGISKLPEGKASMSWVEVVLKKGAKVSVEGFGLPYANVNHPAHEWLQHPDSAPVVGDKTLLDILQQEKFTFIVSEPHPRLFRFRYPSVT
ncbi:hypothetical protein FCULG_00010287 [Fusarium culmorum]|uniref:Uncharacterized protein n=1 Tax=Fusarium culmorum TaxID=5516 RepID=A0A2T4GD43_FUSCU|nr:hypothetical protein FCULG_00010287 [Fusarium culmorum]